MIQLQYTKQRGFALPTILVAAVVMMVVMLAGVQSAVSVRVALDNQRYDTFAKEAAESGISLAMACLRKTGTVDWSTANPLRPNTACTGGAACSSGDFCYVLSQTDVRSTFSIGTPEAAANGGNIVRVDATVERLRSSGAVWQTHTSTLRARIPAIVPATVADLVVNDQVLCFISGGAGYCNGGNTNLELGNGVNNRLLYSTPTPTRLVGDMVAKNTYQMSVGIAHACALDNSGAGGIGGKAYCWGLGGALGINASGDRAAPTAVYTGGVLAGKTLKKIAVSGGNNTLIGIPGSLFIAHTCAIDTTGDAFCWGDDHSSILGADGGQLGDGNTYQDQALPVAVNGANKYTDITAGIAHTCAIRQDTKLMCWGHDGGEAIGNGPGVSSTGIPVAVQSDDAAFAGKSFDYIKAGPAHNCAHASDNTLWCWGNNGGGQLGQGIGSTTDSGYARKVAIPAGETGWKTVATGLGYACGISLTGKAYCWGQCSSTCGDGTSNPLGVSDTPRAVSTAGVLTGKNLTNIWGRNGVMIVRDNANKYYAWGPPGCNLRGDSLCGGGAALVPISSTGLDNFRVQSTPTIYF